MVIDMVYFDNAATTFPKPDEVYSFMDKFYRECGVNVGRGQHNLANKASLMVSETKNMLKELLNCKDKEVVFTSSATESLNVILQGMLWDDDYTVYVSPFEHNSVYRPVYKLSTEGTEFSVIKDNNFDDLDYAYILLTWNGQYQPFNHNFSHYEPYILAILNRLKG